MQFDFFRRIAFVTRRCVETRTVRALVFVVAGIPTISSAAWLPKGPSQSDPPVVYVWPLGLCPSEARPVPAAVAAGRPGLVGETALAGVALTELSSAIFGVPSQILGQAAKADAAGFSASTTNSRFYYTDSVDTTDGSKPQAAVLTPPNCYAVAVYKSTPDVLATGKSWCEYQPFLDKAPEDCAKDLHDTDDPKLHPIDNLRLVARLNNDQSLRSYNLPPPDLYVEIFFEALQDVTAMPADESKTTPTPKASPSGIKPPKSLSAPAAASAASSPPDAKPESTLLASIVIPRARTVYYPHSLLSERSEKKRSLTVSIALSQVAKFSTVLMDASGAPTHNQAAEAGLLNVDFTLYLDAMNPGGPRYNQNLATYPQPWAFIPSLNQNFKVVATDYRDLALMPVSVTASVHEVGDPSIFLAALAQATQSAGTDYSKALVNAVLPPPGTLTPSQTSQKNAAAVSLAGVNYASALTAFQRECSKPTVSDPKAEGQLLNALWLSVTKQYQVAAGTAGEFDQDTGLDKPSPIRPNCAGALGGP